MCLLADCSREKKNQFSYFFLHFSVFPIAFLVCVGWWIFSSVSKITSFYRVLQLIRLYGFFTTAFPPNEQLWWCRRYWWRATTRACRFPSGFRSPIRARPTTLPLVFSFHAHTETLMHFTHKIPTPKCLRALGWLARFFSSRSAVMQKKEPPRQSTPKFSFAEVD